MTEWIDINLPWSVSVEIPKPEYPTEIADKTARDRFGATEEDLANAFEKKHGVDEYTAFSNLRDKISDRIYKVTENSDEDPEDKIQEELQNSKDPIAVDLRDLKKKRNEIREYQNNLPQVMSWYMECEKIRAQERLLESERCFSASKYNRPGVLIEVQYQDEYEDSKKTLTRRFLLGNINCLRGVCDDCTAFDSSAVVLRAKVLVHEGELSMEQTVRELAYKLWQVRMSSGMHTSAEQDWVDAEKMYNSLKKDDIEKAIAEMPMKLASEPEPED